jgi:hypothetical protein
MAQNTTATLSSFILEIRQRVRDIDTAKYMWSDAYITSRIAYKILSPFLWSENTMSWTINPNQNTFTLPADYPRFSTPHRLYFRDTGVTPYDDYEVNTKWYRIFGGVIDFYVSIYNSNFNLVLFYYNQPTAPVNSGDVIDLLSEQLEILRDIVSISLIQEDPRPTWESTRLIQMIQSELNQNILANGLTISVD